MTVSKEVKALISLLEDPDLEVYNSVKTKLIEYGCHIIPDLENVWEMNFDSLIQSRAEEIIHDIQFNSTKAQLEDWLASSKKDLLKAWLILSKFHYPDLDEEWCNQFILDLQLKLKEELHNGSTEIENIMAINRILFNLNGFRGNIKNFHSHDNSLINTVLKSKKGNPLSLCMIYIILAQSINLPICGVNLPRHFVLGYENENALFGDPIKFYINPFSKGSIINRQDLEVFLKREKIKEDSSFFTACGNKAMIKRLINNLLHSYTYSGKQDYAHQMLLLLQIFKK